MAGFPDVGAAGVGTTQTAPPTAQTQAKPPHAPPKTVPTASPQPATVAPADTVSGGGTGDMRKVVAKAKGGARAPASTPPAPATRRPSATTPRALDTARQPTRAAALAQLPCWSKLSDTQHATLQRLATEKTPAGEAFRKLQQLVTSAQTDLNAAGRTALLAQAANYPHATTIQNLTRLGGSAWFSAAGARDEKGADQERLAKVIAGLSHHGAQARSAGHQKLIANTLDHLLDPAGRLIVALKSGGPADTVVHALHERADVNNPLDIIWLNRDEIGAGLGRLEGPAAKQLALSSLPHETNHAVNRDDGSTVGFKKLEQEYRSWYIGRFALNGQPPTRQECFKRCQDILGLYKVFAPGLISSEHAKIVAFMQAFVREPLANNAPYATLVSPNLRATDPDRDGPLTGAMGNTDNRAAPLPSIPRVDAQPERVRQSVGAPPSSDAGALVARNIARLESKPWFEKMSRADRHRAARMITILSEEHHKATDPQQIEILKNTLEALLAEGSRIRLRFDEPLDGHGKSLIDANVIVLNAREAGGTELVNSPAARRLALHTLPHEVNHFATDTRSFGFPQFMKEYNGFYVGYIAEHGHPPTLREAHDRAIGLLQAGDGAYKDFKSDLRERAWLIRTGPEARQMIAFMNQFYSEKLPESDPASAERLLEGRVHLDPRAAAPLPVATEHHPRFAGGALHVDSQATDKPNMDNRLDRKP